MWIPLGLDRSETFFKPGRRRIVNVNKDADRRLVNKIGEAELLVSTETQGLRFLFNPSGVLVSTEDPFQRGDDARRPPPASIIHPQAAIVRRQTGIEKDCTLSLVDSSNNLELRISQRRLALVHAILSTSSARSAKPDS